ncbi:MAG: hypothetical protein HY297_03245 [Thaumarchaeota archaeon]|nr:hypothetical protein [Nitrososphaerota archaeon]
MPRVAVMGGEKTNQVGKPRIARRKHSPPLEVPTALVARYRGTYFSSADSQLEFNKNQLVMIIDIPLCDVCLEVREGTLVISTDDQIPST